jgi:Flp pilus assembly protein TadB
MPDARVRRVRGVRPPEPPLDRVRVLWAVLSTVLITVLFVVAIVTLKGGFAALVVVGYLVWLWVVLRRLRVRRRR